jgi:hypothetical protein
MLLELVHDAWPTLTRWVAMQNRAWELDLDIPLYAKRGCKTEFERQVALCAARIKAEEATADIPYPPLPTGPFAPAIPCQLTLAKPARGAPLPPQEAASRFQAWLVQKGHVGAFNSKAMSALYATYCKEANVLKTPENRLRRELKRVPGVAKVQVDKRYAGKGPRPILWEISAPAQERRAA